MILSRRAVLTEGLAVNALAAVPMAAAKSGTRQANEIAESAQLTGGLSAEAFGAGGDGETDDTSALRSAFAAAIQSGRPVVLKSGATYRIDDLRIPSGTMLVVEPGASLKPARPGAQLRIDGTISSQGNGQIFRAGWQFAKTDILDGYEDVPLEWFGGLASWSEKPDSSEAFSYALRFCSAMRSRTILLSNGCYFVTKPIIISAAIGIRGRGIQSTFLFGRANTRAPVIELVGTRALGISYIAFSDFAIMASEPTMRIGIRSNVFTHVALARVDFRNFSVGLHLAEESYSWKIDDCRFLDNTTHIDLGTNANNTVISACQFLHGKCGIHLTGSSNSVTIGQETNFEGIDGNPVVWSGTDTEIIKLAILDCRFEKCRGFVGSGDAVASVASLSFERNFVADNSGSSDIYLKIARGRNIVIAGNYFERANKALVDIPPAVTQVTIRDNDLVRIPNINAATVTGGLAKSDGFARSRAYNCSGVRGSLDPA